MNGQPESQQLQNFHERLNKWVSNQGFWFQLRYSVSGMGQKGAMTYHFLKLAARVSLFLVIAAAGFYIFMVKQAGSAAYAGKVQEGFRENFLADEIELQGFQRDKGEFYISRMAMTGGTDTFFSSMELRNLKCRMGLFDSFRKEWDPGLIEISRASVGIRSGADSKEDAASMAKVLFQDLEGIRLRAIEVDDMSLTWGYSDRTRGRITGSRMRAQKLEDGWRLKFTGGTLSQNWLKRLDIVEMEVVLNEGGVVFEKGNFKRGKGFVTLVDVKVKAGERPEVSGKLNLRKIDISSIVPVAVRNYVEGTVSGELGMFGSTNSTKGVGFEGDIDLDGEDIVVLRDQVHLLRALSVVDSFNNYRRLDFREGSFHMKSHGGNLELTDVSLKTDDSLTMKGDMTVRVPTEEEAKTFTDQNPQEAILNEDELGERPDLSLKSAANVSKSSGKIGFEGGDENSLFDRLGVGNENRRLEDRSADQLARAYRYDGEFELSLPPNAFSRSPKLAELHPIDPATNRVKLNVPLGGLVLYEVTMAQADDIYQNGTRQ